MNHILLALGRGIVIFSSAFGVATAANLGNHKDYWERTIQRVQTTDFNLLSHMLPAKLSQAILAGDETEIQNTLNSNYGVFGIVVTDCKVQSWECSEQKILYITESKRSWREKVTRESLRYHPFDLLRDPPPLQAEMKYENSRDLSWQRTGNLNPGKVIGRVYYIRGIPPSFFEAYTKWIGLLPGSLLSDSGSSKYYALTLSLFSVGGLAVWGLVEWGFYRKRIKKKQFQREMDRMEQELEQTREELENQLQQVSDLISERMDYVYQLEHFKQREDEREVSLNRYISDLKAQIARKISPELVEETKAVLATQISQQGTVIATLQKEIAAREYASTYDSEVIDRLKQEFQQVSAERRQSQQEITDLQHQITNKDLERQSLLKLVIEQTKAKLEAQIFEQEGSIASLAVQIEAYESDLIQNTQIINELKLNQQQSQQAVTDLQQQTIAKEQDRENLVKQLEEAQREAEQAKHQGTETQHQRDILQRSLRELEEQKKILEEQIKRYTDPALNEFEKDIVAKLNQNKLVNSGVWRISSSKNIQCRGKENPRQFVDCLIFTPSCVVVVEAKNYAGQIRAEGEALTTAWFCIKPEEQSRIESCHGCNPYEQVSAYINSVINQLKPIRRKQEVPVYGIIIFPDDADIHALPVKIDRYTRIVQLKELISTVQALEKVAISKSDRWRNPISAQDLEDTVFGRSRIRNTSHRD